MDAEDRALLTETIAVALPAHGDWQAGDEALAALGWDDLLTAEPITGAAIVFGQLGRNGTAATVLDDVVGRCLGLPVGSTVVHPAHGSATPPGSINGGALQIDGLVSPRHIEHESLVVATHSELVTVSIAGLEIVESTEAELWQQLIADTTMIVDRQELHPDAWATATRAARHALGHELHGVAVSMLELARAHAIERIQFGRPIGSFQAVRHKLAETLVAVESAAGAMAAADENPSDLLVDLGRAAAGRSVRIAARHCQQVLAGIGFTREHDFHRFLFRSLTLEGVYGDTAGISAALGAQLLETGEVPRLIEL